MRIVDIVTLFCHVDDFCRTFAPQYLAALNAAGLRQRMRSTARRSDVLYLNRPAFARQPAVCSTAKPVALQQELLPHAEFSIKWSFMNSTKMNQVALGLFGHARQL